MVGVDVFDKVARIAYLAPYTTLAGAARARRLNTCVAVPDEYFPEFRPHGCNCGAFGGPARECRCSFIQIRNYMSRISGPLLDRIDIHIEVPRVAYRELRDRRPGLGSKEMRQQVVAARERQSRRFGATRVSTNARMSNRQIHQFCELDADGEAMLDQVFVQHAFSARSYTRILKLARTIADLAGEDRMRLEHVSEAIQYRSTERHFWR